jgi:deazaflavin-dependent oxidoreductase (nitroreductase family)
VPAERTRQLRLWERQLERIAATRPGGWFFVNIGNRVDPFLLRVTGGRLSTGVGQPVLLLIHRGARSGEERSTPLVFGTDGDDMVLIASKAGSTRHPAWYHNLRAHPRIQVMARGRSGEYVAREAEGAERERLWAKMCDLYAGYETYQDRAGSRRIPVMVLSPAGVDRA